MVKQNINNKLNSALWAAYGDAIGFITELANEKNLDWRTSGKSVETTIPWKRKIGGRFGVIVDLPAGCYSDDTQLRLSTSRAIRGDGKFDVEAFAKVELPVWLSYALGAGKGSKSAAASLAKRDVSWESNFFETKDSRYIDGGGNGAAMRIQPHIWASRDLKNFQTFLPDIIRNSICTHGHPRGFLGAVFHGLCLAYALENKTSPGPEVWKEFTSTLNQVPQFIKDDNDLYNYWLPTWEKYTNEKIEESVKRVSEEYLDDIKTVELFSNNAPEKQYVKLVQDTGGMGQHRGSGSKTSLYAAFLAWKFNKNPKKAMDVSINLLGSDTDTIATMAGAILGAFVDSAPPGEICDKAYIENEMSRLCSISQGVLTESFNYPDLLKWNATSIHSNYVGILNGKLAISGFGNVEPCGEPYCQKTNNPACWQWLKLPFGQIILAKINSKMVKIPLTNVPVKPTYKPQNKNTKPRSQGNLFTKQDKKDLQKQPVSSSPLTLNEVTSQVIKSNFDPTIIGKLLIEISKREDGIEQTIAFSSIIAKAIKARNKQ